MKYESPNRMRLYISIAAKKIQWRCKSNAFEWVLSQNTMHHGYVLRIWEGEEEELESNAFLWVVLQNPKHHEYVLRM